MASNFNDPMTTLESDIELIDDEDVLRKLVKVSTINFIYAFQYEVNEIKTNLISNRLES